MFAIVIGGLDLFNKILELFITVRGGKSSTVICKN